MKGVIYLNNNKKPSENEKDGKVPTPQQKDIAPLPEKEFIEEPDETKQTELPEENETFPTIENPLSDITKQYVREYKHALEEEKKIPKDPIYVDEVASQIANLYEKVRRVIDWKEEHLVRRTSIERILKRRLISEISEITLIPELDPTRIAQPMTLEFIRTGYFENGKIPETKIEEVKRVLKKYVHILKHSPYAKEGALAIKAKVHFYNWILSIAACEFDELLEPTLKKRALLEFMTQDIFENTETQPPNALLEEERYIQTYVATHRALYGLDDPLIYYQVIKKTYPEFILGQKDFIEDFAHNIESIWRDLEEKLDHPKRSEFQRVCEKFDAAYRVLGDMMKKLENQPDLMEKNLSNKQKVKALAEEAYQERLKSLKGRLYRSAIYATLSIFVAGAASLLIFEYPVAKFFYGQFAPLALIADIGIPTTLMFFLIWSIKPPGETNLPVVIDEIYKIIHTKEKRNAHKIKLDKSIKKIKKALFGFLYLLGGVGSLYLIFLVFMLAGTPPTSLYINTANVALVVFAATIIRNNSKEITIKEKANLLEFFLDFFSIPLAKIGSWLSSKWKEFNFVSVFFSTLIDTPFSTFISALEDWREYIKEKRAEL
jgi:uncharacterized membrane protein YfcA